MTCVHHVLRRDASEWTDDMICRVRKLHYEPRHSDPKFVGDPGTKEWSIHMAWRTIVRQEWRRRGCP